MRPKNADHRQRILKAKRKLIQRDFRIQIHKMLDQGGFRKAFLGPFLQGFEGDLIVLYFVVTED